MYQEKKGVFSSMHPKASFFFGLVSGIAIISILAMVGLFSGVSLSSVAALATDGEQDSGTLAKATTTVKSTANKASAGNPPPVSDQDHIRGSVDAPLTWVEYSDFECPFCKRFHPTMQQMLEEYDGKIKLVYRHFPLSFHEPLATKEAEASECANELGGNSAFWDYADLIFERTSSNGRGLDEEELPAMAEEIGLDREKFTECLDSGKYKEHIKDDISGGSKAGITGTPGSFLIDEDGNAQKISGALPYSTIQPMIEDLLN